MLDRAGDDLLSQGPSAWAASDPLGIRISQVIQHLTGSGAVRQDDPALLRLGALAWRLGLQLGTGLPGAGHPGASRMPAAWASLLVDADAQDGPEGTAAFAVALPEIDGARLALAGLRSARDDVTLHVKASGWEPLGAGWLRYASGPYGDPLDTALSWQVRDSTGRWHLVRGMSWSATNTMIQMQLVPPLHPAATAIEVIVTGATRRVRATIPLAWQAAGGPVAR